MLRPNFLVRSYDARYAGERTDRNKKALRSADRQRFFGNGTLTGASDFWCVRPDSNRHTLAGVRT